MRKLRFLALGAALTITAFATQRPVQAVQMCNQQRPYFCVCPGGVYRTCTLDYGDCISYCQLMSSPGH